jgi:hypothetical protein
MAFAKDYNVLLNEILTSYQNMGPIVQLDSAKLKAERPDIYNEYLLQCQPDTSKGSLLFLRAAGLASMFYGLYKSLDNVIDQFFSSTANRMYLERQAADFIVSVLNKTDQELSSEISALKSGKIMGGNKYDYIVWAKQVSVDYSISNPTSDQFTNSGLNKFSAADLLDEDTSTMGFGLDAPGNIVIDLGNSTKSYTKLKIYIDGSDSTAIFDISYSDDNNLWSSIGQISSTQSGWNELSWSDVGAHQYWKLTLTATDSDGNYVTSLQLLEGPERVVSALPYPLARGEGTFDVIVTSNLSLGQPSQDLIDAVTAYLRDRRPVAGGYDWGMRVLGPNIESQTIAITGSGVNWNKVQTKSDIISFVNSLEVEQTLYLSQLHAIAIQNGADSIDISSPATDIIPYCDYAAGVYGVCRAGSVSIL